MSINSNWYILHVQSCFERKVAKILHDLKAENKLLIEEIVVPIKEIVEVVHGEKICKQNIVYPGYVFVKFDLAPETVSALINLDRVIKFVGHGGKPSRITKTEMEAVFLSAGTTPEIKRSFFVGDNVKVCSGPFESFCGIVDDVDEVRERVKISIPIFGRSTALELAFCSVEKV